MLRQILGYLLQPLTAFWLLVLWGVVAYYWRKRTMARVLGLAALSWLLLLSTPFFPQYLLARLENQYPQRWQLKDSALLDAPNIHILVLAAGYVPAAELPWSAQLSTTSLSRLVEGIRIYQGLPQSKLIFTASGAPGDPNSLAVVFARAAQELGVDATRIELLPLAENTYTEAWHYRRKFGHQTPLILVTSASHMPRAKLLFQKLGLQPMAAPTNFLLKKSSYQHQRKFLPSPANLGYFEVAVHEYLGILWAKLGGR